MSEELSNTVDSIVNNAFSTVLSLDPILNPAAMVVSRGQPYLTSTVQITGAWKGVVSISVPVELGVQIAAIMFEEDPDCIDSDDLEDALGEVSNIVSGSFKSTRDGICHLGLPVVTQGIDYVVRFPGSHVACDVGFEVSDFCFHVTLVEADSD